MRARRNRRPLTPLNRSSIYGIVNPRLADIGVTGRRYGPHCLRATSAVLAYYAGATIVQVQQLLRHRSVQTTMRYLASIVPAEADAAVAATAIALPTWSPAGAQPAVEDAS